MVDLDAALGQELLRVALGQPEAQIPPNGQEDGLGREAETPEGGCLDDRHGMTARCHADSLPGQPGISHATVPDGPMTDTKPSDSEV